MTDPFAETPEPPYFVVVFTSQRTDVDALGYADAAERMVELASRQPGFLGVESVRDATGVGITVSYWRDLESIERWREQGEHAVARAAGRDRWYRGFRVRVARVERSYEFDVSDVD